MHICYLCNEYPPERHGGIGSMTQTLARALVARGHRVTVLGVCLSGDSGTEWDGEVRVVRLPHATLRRTGVVVNGRRLRQTLRRVAREAPIDVLEGPEAALALVPRVGRATMVIRMHGGHRFFSEALGTPVHPWKGWLERTSFRRADRLCAVSRHVATRTSALLALGERPIEILPNPVDTDEFRPMREVPEADGLIAFVGTLCEKKGVGTLMRAFPEVAAALPGARLRLIGRDTMHPATGQPYSALALGQLPAELRGRVEVVGPLPRTALPAELARAQLCVYPSFMEAMPLAWLEGMAMGKAIVASVAGPGREVVDDGISGLLCDPRSPRALATAIIQALGDGALRRWLGDAARQRAVNAFSTAVLVAKNEAFYERCLA